MKFDTSLASSLRHPLSLVGYALFLCAYVTLQFEKQEIAYAFLAVSLVSIVGAFVYVSKKTRDPEERAISVNINNNDKSDVSGNKIKASASIEGNKSTSIKGNEIG